MTKSKIRFVNSYEKLLSLSIHNEEIWEKNTNYAPHKLHMLNSQTFKNSHYFSIPDPRKGLPSFEKAKIHQQNLKICFHWANFK